MRRAYAIGVLDSIEDTLKVHMYWLNVQGLRVKAFVVCCLLFNVCCLGHSRRSTVDKQRNVFGGARKHTCDVDMRRAYALGVLDSIEDTLNCTCTGPMCRD